jgi:dihydrofolate reductase
MAKLIYITNTSLDGYIEDQAGAFDWVNSDQVFDFITELLRPIKTYLLGRRLHQTMAYWDARVEGYPPEQRDFAQIWQNADKIVFSRTLTVAPTRNTRVERDFDVESVRKPGGNRSTTSSLAAPSWRDLRSNPISSTNVTCFSTR